MQRADDRGNDGQIVDVTRLLQGLSLANRMLDIIEELRQRVAGELGSSRDLTGDICIGWRFCLYV